jgi:hypothetical protein
MGSETDVRDGHCNKAWSDAGFCKKAKGGGDQPRSRTIGAILSVDSGATIV